MTRAALFVILAVAILISLCLLLIVDTTAAQIIIRSLDINTHAVLLMLLCYGRRGLGLGFLIYTVGYETLLRFSIPALIFGTLLLAILFVPGIGQTVNGARRWIGCWGFTFQPSEWIKILVPAAYIHWAVQREEITLSAF